MKCVLNVFFLYKYYNIAIYTYIYLKKIINIYQKYYLYIQICINKMFGVNW